ncbi:MAG: hypothetical protein JWO77_310, partial [Ilumatobacteraceae bacterium]|nr:hypothetical protein [Ilumatobacteraceae bacterium]
MTRRRALSVGGAALVLAATLAGCGLFGSDDASPTTTTRPAPTTTTTTEAPTATSEPPELLDPGSEPRQALRVAYTEGAEATVTFTSDLEVRQTSAGRVQRLDSPPIGQTLTYTVGTVTDDGAELTVRIDAIGAKGKGTGLSDEELAAIDDELTPLVGLTATATATPLGELEGLAFDAPEDLPEDLAAQLDTLAEQLPALGPALPSEAVGVGASWRSTSTTSVGGAEVATTSTITVTAIDDGAIRYTATTTTTSAAPQDLALDGLADGTTARLESSDLTGATTGAMGLDRILLELRTSLSGSQAISLDDGSTTTDLTQAIDLA